LAKMIQEQRNKNEKANPIFVMEADFNDNKETFKNMGLNAAPMMVLIPPTNTKKQIPLNKFFKSIGPKYQYSLTNGRTAEDVLVWISKISDLSLKVPTKYDIPDLKYVLVIIIALLIMVYKYRSYIDKVRHSMFLYSMMSLGVYSFIIGGGMFTIIRQTPWFQVEKGHISYISNMSRYQYGIEGYFVGAANLLAGVGAFAYIKCQQVGNNENENKNKKFRLWNYIPTWAPFCCMVAGWYFLMFCYTLKNGHYNFGHVGMHG